MSCTKAVLADNKDLPAGELISASPYNVSAYEVFENGLVEGRFVKYDTGSIDNLDASATPLIAGISKRKVTGEIGTGVYSTTGTAIDSVAEVINFGFATVSTAAAADPSKYEAVQFINVAGAEAGMATEQAVATGIVNVPNVVFWEQKAANVWLVRINQYI